MKERIKNGSIKYLNFMKLYNSNYRLITKICDWAKYDNRL